MFLKIDHVLSISADLSFRSSPISNLDPLQCVGTAYELAGSDIYVISIGRGLINLLKGLVDLITGLVAPPINAIGYHTVHNYICGISYTASPQAIVRIGATGAWEAVGPNAVIPASVTTERLLIGDIDTNQQYWLGYDGGQGWVQVDMDVISATYGTLKASGNTTGYRYPVGDWAYLPDYPNRLYALAQENVSNFTGIAGILSLYNTHLVYLDLETKEGLE